LLVLLYIFRFEEKPALGLWARFPLDSASGSTRTHSQAASPHKEEEATHENCFSCGRAQPKNG